MYEYLPSKKREINICKSFTMLLFIGIITITVLSLRTLRFRDRALSQVIRRSIIDIETLSCRITKSVFLPVFHMTHCLSQTQYYSTELMEYSVLRYQGAKFSNKALNFAKYLNIFLKEPCQHGTTWFSESYFSVIQVPFSTYSPCEKLMKNHTSCNTLCLIFVNQHED